MTTHENAPDPHDQTQPQNQTRPPLQPPRTHLSPAGLRARGWTPGMMRQLLGEPDLLRTNPHLDSAPHTRLYSIERVEAVERSEAFRAASAVASRRSAAARAAALRRRREVLVRMAVDHLRHRLTRYDQILDELYGRTGRAAAEELLRNRVYAALSEAYPSLAQECERQLREGECGPPPG